MYLLKKYVQFKIRSYMAVAGCIQPKDLYDNPIVPIHSFSGKSGFSLDRLSILKVHSAVCVPTAPRGKFFKSEQN